MIHGKFRIIVGEPWDYEDRHGDNTIEGRIVRVVSPQSVVFQSDEIVEFKEQRGRILLLGTRYEGDTLDLTKRGRVETIAGGLYLGTNYRKGDYTALENDSIYVLIGSLHRA